MEFIARLKKFAHAEDTVKRAHDDAPAMPEERCCEREHRALCLLQCLLPEHEAESRNWLTSKALLNGPHDECLKNVPRRWCAPGSLENPYVILRTGNHGDNRLVIWVEVCSIDTTELSCCTGLT